MPPATEPAPLFDTIVIATDGSESVRRAIDVALDLAHRFEAARMNVKYPDVTGEGTHVLVAPSDIRRGQRLTIPNDGSRGHLITAEDAIHAERTVSVRFFSRLNATRQ